MTDTKQEVQGAAGAASSTNCTADYRHPCDANDGEPCAACAEWIAAVEAEARREWAVMSPLERNPAKYEREMRDAWRRP